MPSVLHEALVDLFRHRPRVAADLLAADEAMPAFDSAAIEDPGFSAITPVEYRADVAMVLRKGASAVLGVVVEVQLGKDQRKKLSWPVYGTALRARLACPVRLVVVAPLAAVARWAAEPIHLGGPSRFVPDVFGPDRIRPITDPVEASRSPELALISALTHGASRDGKAVVLGALAAAGTLDDERSKLYADLILAAAGPAVAAEVEAMVLGENYEYQSDFAKKYFAQGREEGRREGLAQALLTVLAGRGFDVSSEHRARVTSCSDAEQIERWTTRALTAATIDSVFDTDV